MIIRCRLFNYGGCTDARFLQSSSLTRVARQPIKKLGLNERLISPVNQLMDRGFIPEGLIEGIAAALRYDYAQDSEAVELQQKINAQGVQKTLSEISGLHENHPLIEKVTALYNQQT